MVGCGACMRTRRGSTSAAICSRSSALPSPPSNSPGLDSGARVGLCGTLNSTRPTGRLRTEGSSGRMCSTSGFWGGTPSRRAYDTTKQSGATTRRIGRERWRRHSPRSATARTIPRQPIWPVAAWCDSVALRMPRPYEPVPPGQSPRTRPTSAREHAPDSISAKPNSTLAAIRPAGHSPPNLWRPGGLSKLREEWAASQSPEPPPGARISPAGAFGAGSDGQDVREERASVMGRLKRGPSRRGRVESGCRSAHILKDDAMEPQLLPPGKRFVLVLVGGPCNGSQWSRDADYDTIMVALREHARRNGRREELIWCRSIFPHGKLDRHQLQPREAAALRLGRQRLEPVADDFLVGGAWRLDKSRCTAEF